MKIRMKKILSLALAFTLAFSVPNPEMLAKAATTANATAITIDGDDVDAAAKNINGLTYKGFGMLNGNSTSNLLLEYKDKAPEKYWEMMNYLFGGEYPLFTHIKMEMGNDGNNSTGAEACTMRYEDEEADASRSPGFVMVADAKTINPDVKVSILRWEMPNWVKTKWNNNTNNQGYEAMYKWYKETIFDAYEKYGYMVDFVNPDKNETSNPDEAFIKWYANRVANETEFPAGMSAEAQEAYKNIRIIASDENKSLEIVPSMLNDNELFEAVDIIGFHYRTDAGDLTDKYVAMAEASDKEVWYSEGCATFGYSELQENKTATYGYKSIGGYQSPLALVDSFITAFDSTRRTHYMFQPAIGAFYEGIQYAHKELLSARDPWSGYIHYDPALYMLQHFAGFAKTGWEDSEPDTNDIWRVIKESTDGAFEGSASEHNSAGINGNAGYMTLAAPDKSDFSVVFVNNTQNEKVFTITTENMEAVEDKDLQFWLTETDNYMQDKGIIENDNGTWTVTLPAYCVATATTLDKKASTPARTPDEGIHNEDRAVLDTDATGGTNGVTTDNVLYADNFEYKEEAKGFLEKRGNEPRYMLDTHGAWIVEGGRLKQELGASVAQWNPGEPSTIVGDFRWMDTDTSIDVLIPGGDANVVARLTVRAQFGMNWNQSGYTLEINGAGDWKLYRIDTVVASGTVAKNAKGKYNVKIRALGNNISVAINDEGVADYVDAVPMLSGRVKISSTWSQIYFDNLLVETVKGGTPYATTMIDGQDDAVSYEGTWAIENPGGGKMEDWYRTVSSTSTANSAFSFNMTGAGFSIIGSNGGTAKLDVYVDDELVDENAVTLATPTRGETYIYSGLENTAHTIKVVVKSGTLNIDAIHMLDASIPAEEVTDPFVTAKNLPSIDVIGAGSEVTGLPETVELVTRSGNVVEKAVTWDTSAEALTGKDFGSTAITGVVEDAVNVFGTPFKVSVPVGMVVPKETYYFIDSHSKSPAADSTTPPYELVKSVAGDTLLNASADQLKSAGNTWGLVNTDTAVKGSTDTNNMQDTGIYGSSNKKGATISYQFTLPAGNYMIMAGHRDWWAHSRNTVATLSYEDTTVEVANMWFDSVSDQYAKAAFTLTEEQLVTYTLTAQGDDAPVISWLAVTAHEHSYAHSYSDNGDGTHVAVCFCGEESTVKESHVFEEGFCTLCGVYHDHTYTYVANADGTHTGSCAYCDRTITGTHAYVNGACTTCGAAEPKAPTTGGEVPHTHAYTSTDNGDGTHTTACACGTSTKEAHTYVNGICSACKAVEQKAADSNTDSIAVMPKIASLENVSKGIKVTWNDVNADVNYEVYRKAGNGAWSKVATTKATSYTDKKANKNGTKYQFKVHAVYASGKADVSEIETTYCLTASKLSSVKNVKGKKLTVKWKKNKKASGYEIEYATAKSFKGSKIAKVSGGKKTSATIKKLKKGKKYFVRVRSYKKSGKVNYYSAWSNVKNVKIKK
ncbi:MAG: fibronectin type III domain-containing protein [Lachnospiraceae bacterium]|nr:fibronectin type III domain-containing protein [Lachnospiraceae bacterium]